MPSTSRTSSKFPVHRRVAAATLATFALALGAVTFAGSPLPHAATATTGTTTTQATTSTDTADPAASAQPVSSSSSGQTSSAALTTSTS